jgi:FMN phosphatase YigB (HAD superfamily)
MPEYPQVLDWISRHIFSGEKYGDRWMRGGLTYRQINRIISEATGISQDLLNERLIPSVRRMKVNPSLIQLAENLKTRGIQVALVTNNMDVFNQVTIPEKQLDKTFPVIINSCNHGLMKQDENGRLFDIAREKLGLPDFKDILLIDDSVTYCDIFKAKGGQAYFYRDQEAFLGWAETMVL